MLRRKAQTLSRIALGRARSFGFFPRIVGKRGPDCPGQFGLPGLHAASDWRPIAAACVSDCLQLADRIRAHPQLRSPSLLHVFDDLSDRLCSVLDVAELCRNVHPNPEFVREADDAFLQVSSVLQELNADYTLYDPLDRLYDDHLRSLRNASDRARFLSDEDVVMVRSLKHDFERGGIALGRREKEHLIQLQERASSLGADFVSNSATRAPVLDLPEAKLRQLPLRIRRHLKPSQKPQHLRVHVDAPMLQVLLKWIPDSRVREQVYRSLHGHEAWAKSDVLDSLLETRKALAVQLGQRSYADLLFSDRVASSPTDVLEFLERLSQFVKEAGHQERNSIEIEKLRLEPYTAQGGRAPVQGWDRSFYIGRLKAQRFDLSSAEVSNYLPLSACLLGLADVVEHVFGVKMNRLDPDHGELWHEDVQKIELVEENGRTLGHIFLDLYPREGKYGHAAHFSIRCGRQPAGQRTYQTPTVALVCNFGRGSCHESPLLSISEYETLFHEFGHSLHSLLSETKYQHLSGTRVTTDFVEVPSHVFEHFAWDPRILSRFARHHTTGDPMPTRLVRSLCASRKGFVSTDIQLQTLFSAMDLRFHGSDPPLGRTTEVFEELQTKLTSYPADNGVPVPSTFHHFVGYGAGYYSYIFARIISAQLWSALFEENPLCRDGGNCFRKGLLAHGGAKDAAFLLRNVLDGDVSCTPFLQSTGVDIREWQQSLKLPLSSPAK